MNLFTSNRTTCIAILFLIFPLSLWAKESIKNQQLKPVSLSFIENKGQIINQFGEHRNDIDYCIAGSGLNIFVGSAALHYQWSKPKGKPMEIGANGRPVHHPDCAYDIYRMDVSLAGANTKAVAVVEDKLDFSQNYYLPQCPNGVTAFAYRKITYKNVYPDIDWVLYIHGDNEAAQTLKYDFVVHPGGNASDIKLSYSGTTGLKIKHGALTAVTPLGSITEQQPVCYEQETKKPVTASYALNEKELSFDVEDHEGTLVIDPAIDWSTYYGGSGSESGYTIVTDTASNVYFGGFTTSSSLIATSGTAQSSYSTFGYDAFVVKFDKAGARQWGTYYGGAGVDDFFSSTIDTFGFVYFAGTTSSSGLGYGTVYQGSFAGASDNIIVKFNPVDGTRIWATYFGGSGSEGATGSEYETCIACDSKNNLFLCGNTKSSSGISFGSGIYQGSLNTAVANRCDGYLAKFTINGAGVWATYLGGPGNDKARKIAFDASGNVYVGGDADSNGLGTSGTYKPGFTSNPTGLIKKDAFIAKFNQSGALQWGTYYGGTDEEFLEGLIADASDYIYIAGSTQSDNTNNYIATSGAFQTSNASPGLNDCFLAKFDANGQRVWSTFFGSSAVDHGGDMTIDAFGNICFTGSTGGTGLATPGAYQFTKDPGTGINFDGFFAIFTIDGFRYYGSYFGGPATDFTYGLKYSSKGDLYLAGFSNSTSGISTSGSYQQNVSSGSQDAFLARFKADTSAYVITPLTFTTACAGDSIFVPYGITSTFRPGNVFALQLSNSSGSFASPVTIGYLASINPGILRGYIPPTTPLGNGYRIRITSTVPSSTSFDNGTDIPIRALPAKPVAVSNTPLCSAEGPLNLTATTTTSGVTWGWTGPQSFTAATQNTSISSLAVNKSGNYIVTVTLNGCSQRDTETVVINQSPVKPTVGGNTPVCSGSTLSLTASTSTSGVTWGWTGPNGFASSVQNPGRPNVGQFDGGWYVAIDTLGTCTQKDSVLIAVNYIQKPVASYNGPLCSSVADLVITATTSTSGVSYSWTGPSFSQNGQTQVITTPTTVNAGNYYVTVTKNGCTQKDTLNVVINATPAKPNVGGNTPLCSGSSLNLTATSTTPGVTWGWTGPAGFTSSVQNPVVANISAAGSGYYVAVDSQLGCIAKDSIFITVNPTRTPAVTIATQNGVTAICIGDSVLFTAYGSNGGPTPGYQWLKNGNIIPGKTNATYMGSGLVNGDAITCRYIGSGPCLTKAADTSTPITIQVKTLLIPKVGIDVAPGMKIGPHTQVVLTAVDTFGGIAPLYQWYKNSTAIAGAISKIFVFLPGVDAVAGDKYCVLIHSVEQCTNPDTASGCTDPLVIDLGVKNTWNDEEIELYPNPSTGVFTITAKLPGEREVNMEVVNAVGQVVYSDNAAIKNGLLHQQVSLRKDLPDGMYILRIRGEKEQKLVRFILDK